MAAVKRLVPLGVNYGISLSKLGGINNVAINVHAASLLVNRSQCKADKYNFKFYSSYSSKSSAHNKFGYRQMCQMVKLDGKRAFLVDTLAMVISLFWNMIQSNLSITTSFIPYFLIAKANTVVENIYCVIQYNMNDWFHKRPSCYSENVVTEDGVYKEV